MDLFLGSQFCSIDHCVFFCANTLLFQLVYIYTILCNQEAWYLQFCSFSRLFRLFRVFRGSMPILELFVLILWICHWNVDRYCFESIDCFRYSGYFNNINYSYLWTWNIFPICVFSNFFHKYLYNFQFKWDWSSKWLELKTHDLFKNLVVLKCKNEWLKIVLRNYKDLGSVSLCAGIPQSFCLFSSRWP